MRVVTPGEARAGSPLTKLGALIAASALSIGCPLAVEDDYVIQSEDAGAGNGGSGGEGGSGSAGKGGTSSGGSAGKGGTSSGGSGGAPTPTCSDNQRNGNETDVDCGGDCAPCGLGKVCESKNDCESEHCDSATKRCAEED